MSEISRDLLNTQQGLLHLHRNTLKVVGGQQEQIEAPYRILGYQQQMILLLAGHQPDSTEAQQLSEQAAREIRELEALFSKEIPPKSGDTPNGEAR